MKRTLKRELKVPEIAERTLKRELKVPEIAEREANGTSLLGEIVVCYGDGLLHHRKGCSGF